MKKIKKMKQLKAEQKYLLQRESELESTIQKNWDELKESLRPVNMAKEAFSKWANKRQPVKSGARALLAGGLTAGTAFLAKRLIGKWSILL